jgi:radical SAM protein with 4Fe4S-binding SPASM domain
MSVLSKWFNRPSATDCGPSSGLYHYLREDEFEKSRIHLRIDPDGTGTLIINASSVMHLNPTAALMAYLILENMDEGKAVRTIQQKYRVSKAQAYEDYSSFIPHLSSLIHGACPIHELELDTTMPFSARPSAPYRMDLAVTYRCNNDCMHCYNARERNYPELTTDQWKKILDQLWALGIPHIVFTGGEATLRNDLPELIKHAEANGQITVESCIPEIHDEMMRSNGAFKQTITGLQNVLTTKLYVMTNTTMLKTNVHAIPATLDFLADMGVPTVGLNALIYSGQGLTVGTGLHESELQPILDMATLKTSLREQKLIWYTPTQYCEFDPTASNLGVKGCTAALYSMCIEPNGDVLPCQSYYQSLGNILGNSWDSIWNHKLSVQLRERQNLPQKCESCSLLPECGGGCPLKFQVENLPVPS